METFGAYFVKIMITGGVFYFGVCSVASSHKKDTTRELAENLLPLILVAARARPAGAAGGAASVTAHRTVWHCRTPGLAARPGPGPRQARTVRGTTAGLAG